MRNRASKIAGSRRANQTLLVVGEGYAEREFVRHVCRIYVTRGCGLSVTVDRADGKGGRKVLDCAIRHDRSVMVRAAMLDTDKDWDDEQRARARKRNVVVIECTPCLEAVLLAILGLPRECNTAEHKARFERHFGCEAHRLSHRALEEHYPRGVLDEARKRVPALDQLLQLLSV